MCNACGFGCCASDEFDGCGCVDCYNDGCLPYEDEDYDKEDFPDYGDEDEDYIE